MGVPGRFRRFLGACCGKPCCGSVDGGELVVGSTGASSRQRPTKGLSSQQTADTGSAAVVAVTASAILANQDAHAPIHREAIPLPLAAPPVQQTCTAPSTALVVAYSPASEAAAEQEVPEPSVDYSAVEAAEYKRQVPVLAALGYRHLDTLSIGSGSAVYRCYQSDTGKEVVIKVMANHDEDSARAAAAVELCLRLGQLQRCQRIFVGQNAFEAGATRLHLIVPLVKVMHVSKGKVAFMMEPCTGGTLQESLDSFQGEHRLAHTVIRQVLQVLVHMHTSGVAHGNIMAENFMLLSRNQPLSSRNNVVAIGFSGATTFRFSLYPTDFCPAYSAPEVIKAHIADSTEPEKESGFIYDPQPADIFSAFILILRMLGGDYPASWNFEGDDDDEYEDMERAILTYNDPTLMSEMLDAVPYIENEIMDYRPLLEWMSCFNPRKRPTAVQALAAFERLTSVES